MIKNDNGEWEMDVEESIVFIYFSHNGHKEEEFYRILYKEAYDMDAIKY